MEKVSTEFHLFRLAFSFFKREWRRGDLLVLLFAMSVAMASISVIFLVIDRIESATEAEVADVLGADLVISSPKPLQEKWLNRASELRLNSAQSIEFSSVLFSNEKIQLSSIKAVSDKFPLRGRLEVADTPFSQKSIANSIPKQGNIWVEPRIFSALDLSKDQLVELGYTDLKVNGALMLQPGQGSTLFNIAPTVLMNINDVPATKVIQPGSRVNYRYYYVGEPQSLKIFASEFNSQKNTSQRIVTVFDESPIAGSAVTRSKKYIGLSSLLTIILLGVTIAMSAGRYARRQFDTSALMRCFGMTNTQVLKIYIYILIFVCFFGVLIGSLFGIVFQSFIVDFFAESFIQELPPADYSVLFLPMLATSILLFGFSLPSLMALKSVPPMRVLRRQLEPFNLKNSFVYLISGVTLVFVMWLQMENLKLLIAVLGGLLVMAIIFGFFARFLLSLMKKLARSKSAAINFSLRQLDAKKGVTLLHLLAFSITIFVIALIILVRSELLDKWQQSLGDDIPNHFMVNVKPEDVSPISKMLEKNDLQFSELYPMIRGRIVSINNEDVKTAVSEQGQQHNSLQRELNITWSENLPKGNQVIAGDWSWNKLSTDFQISIEDKTAIALGLEIGDKLGFTIGEQSWQATINSIRVIDWQTFTPNFYVIANPGSLVEFDATYINSFRLPAEKKPILGQIIKQYPSITIIELDLILQEIQNIIKKVSSAVEAIMLFVIAAGIGLLWAVMEHTYEAKYRQSAILRTLGASKIFMATSFRFEYLWLAILSSLMAIFAVESVSYVLYVVYFEIPFSFHWTFWWAIPLSALSLMIIASWRGVQKVTEPSPLSLLRQN